MAIYIEPHGVLGHMFNACTTDQINEFVPEKRGFRIHGHSTTIRLETAFWSVLEDNGPHRTHVAARDDRDDPWPVYRRQ